MGDAGNHARGIDVGPVFPSCRSLPPGSGSLPKFRQQPPPLFLSYRRDSPTRIPVGVGPWIFLASFIPVQKGQAVIDVINVSSQRWLCRGRANRSRCARNGFQLPKQAGIAGIQDICFVARRPVEDLDQQLRDRIVKNGVCVVHGSLTHDTALVTAKDSNSGSRTGNPKVEISRGTAKSFPAVPQGKLAAPRLRRSDWTSFATPS